jgi:hypothetical protein
MPLHEKTDALHPPLWKNHVSLPSPISFMDNQYLGVKKDFRVKESLKDKVILTIILMCSIKLVIFFGSLLLCESTHEHAYSICWDVDRDSCPQI